MDWLVTSIRSSSCWKGGGHHHHWYKETDKRNQRVSSIIVSRTPAPCVCVWFIHRTFACIRVYARRPSFLYFPNWIALSAFRSLTLSSSHQGPTDSPAVPMSHTPARLRTSRTLTLRRSSPGGSRKNCIHTRAIRWTPPSFYATLFRAYLWPVSPSPRHPKKSKQLSFQNSFEICLSWVLASSSPSALTTPDAVSDTQSPFCGRFARENFKLKIKKNKKRWASRSQSEIYCSQHAIAAGVDDAKWFNRGFFLCVTREPKGTG